MSTFGVRMHSQETVILVNAESKQIIQLIQYQFLHSLPHQQKYQQHVQSKLFQTEHLMRLTDPFKHSGSVAEALSIECTHR
jgi:hypothetical protein